MAFQNIKNMLNKSILGTFLIYLLIPFSSTASPTGKFESFLCQYNQHVVQSCQIKSEYGNRMSFLLMTIRWDDGPVTKLKKQTGESSYLWTDAYGGKWQHTSSPNPRSNNKLSIYTNIENGNQIRIH